MITAPFNQPAPAPACILYRQRKIFLLINHVFTSGQISLLRGNAFGGEDESKYYHNAASRVSVWYIIAKQSVIILNTNLCNTNDAAGKGGAFFHI